MVEASPYATVLAPAQFDLCRTSCRDDGAAPTSVPTMPQPIVDVWIDLTCPWSRIGLTGLHRALADLQQPVTVQLHSFQIDPDAPADYGLTTVEALRANLGIAAARADEMLDVVRTAGAEAWLSFNFDIARGGNTLDAHRLLKLAAAHDQQLEVALALFRAHFELGQLLADPAVLARIAAEVHIPASEVQALLTTDQFADMIHDDEAQVKTRGISGRPTFFINNRHAFTGEQSADVLRAALKQASAGS